MKVYITAEQAISVLPAGESVHTFYNMPFGLIGADWSRTDIIDKLENSDKIELTGEAAKSMNHGICAYDNSVKMQSDILFIETDMEKLNDLEAALEKDRHDAIASMAGTD